MIDRLIEMYVNGAMTGYQVMMDCLQMLDPADPDLVLYELPAEILDEMLAYARRYDPRRPRSETSPSPLKTRSGRPNAGYVPIRFEVLSLSISDVSIHEDDNGVLRDEM
jgi:hypothetical protein